MARSGRTRYTVLGALTLGPRSGYDIKKFIEGTTNNFWRESFGQIYPALKQLAAEGLVTKRAEGPTDRPGRIVYGITPAGRGELRAWLEEPHVREVPRVELLLKLFFGTEISPEVTLGHIARERQDLLEGLEAMNGIADWLRAERSDLPGFPYWMLTVRQGILSSQASLKWCDEAERTIRDLDSSSSSS